MAWRSDLGFFYGLPVTNVPLAASLTPSRAFTWTAGTGVAALASSGDLDGVTQRADGLQPPSAQPGSPTNVGTGTLAVAGALVILEAAAAIVQGSSVELASGGKVQTHVSGTIIGTALTGASGSGDLVWVRIASGR